MLVRLDPDTGKKRKRTKEETAEDDGLLAAFEIQKARGFGDATKAIHALASATPELKALSSRMKQSEARGKKAASGSGSSSQAGDG